MSFLPGLFIASLTTIAPHPADRPLADVTAWIEETGVRMTIMLNFQFIDTVLGREGDATRPPRTSEVEEVRGILEKLFAERNRITIDGTAVPPVFESFEVSPPRRELIEREPGFARRLTQVRFRVRHDAPQRPRSLHIKWDFYPLHPLYDLPDSPDGPLAVDAVIVDDGVTSVLPFRTDAREQQVVCAAPPAPASAPPPPVPARAPSLVLLYAAGAGLLLLVATLARRRRALALALTMTGTLAATACGDAAPRVAETESWHVTAAAAIAVNEHFAIDLTVEAKTGDIEPTQVRVDADMPAHGHGMNVKPRVTPLGGGKFRAEGMLFHMPGEWELYVYVGEGAAIERAVFPVQL